MAAAQRKPLRVMLAQMKIASARETNLAQAERVLRTAAKQNVDLVVLPELFLGPYFCQTVDAENFALAELVPGPTTERLGALAAELDLAVVLSVFERRTAGLYHNTSVLVDGARGVVGKYRKLHIPDDPAYYEKFYFTPGDLGFVACPARGSNIGMLVCWDPWFPEAARMTALAGAQVLTYPTAIGWHPDERESLGVAQHAAWEVSQRAHAVANGCFVLAVNRVGFEPRLADKDGDGIQFWGQSFAVGPDGQVLHRCGAEDEELAVVELDLGLIELQRQGWPFLRDRRVDVYEGLTRRYLDD